MNIIGLWHSVYNLWTEVPGLIRFSLVFYVQFIIIRRKVAPKIERETDKLGTIWIKVFRRAVVALKRYAAMLRHYLIEDHSGRVLDCGQNHCQVFRLG